MPPAGLVALSERGARHRTMAKVKRPLALHRFARSIELAGLFLFVSLSTGSCFSNALGAAEKKGAVEISVRDGLLTLRAVEAPLGEVLQEMGLEAGIRVINRVPLYDPVSWTVEDYPLEEAVRHLLARFSYAITYSPSPGGTEVGPIAELRILSLNDADARGQYETRRTIPSNTVIASDEMSSVASEDDLNARLRFVWRMAHQPDSADIGSLELFLSEENHPKVREIAAIGLGKLKEPSVLEALIPALSDSDSLVRRRVVQALGKRNDDRSVEALSDVLFGDLDPEVRRAAARSLGTMRGNDALSALSAGQYDPDYYVRRETGLALERLRNRPTGALD